LLWYDVETDGYQTPNRYYIPRLARWLTPDPASPDITNPQSLNRYPYALNNPTSLIDPSGLMYCDQGSAVVDNDGNLLGYTDCVSEEAGASGQYTEHYAPYSEDVSANPSAESEPDSTPEDPNSYVLSATRLALVPPANNGLTISAAPSTPWYKNSCITSALGTGAVSAAINSIGLIPEAGGVARLIGNQAGYVGVVADQTGSRVVGAVGASTSTVEGLNGLFDTSPTGLLSTGLAVAGFIPGLGQLASGASIVVDAVKTGMEIAQCHP
jgi:RHS repeat-associated protein